jgi:hypothetical protein
MNDPFNNGYSEVSGPDGPPPSNMPMPNAPPPPSQFPTQGGYGPYPPPPPGLMGTSYSMGNREQLNSPPEASGFEPTSMHHSRTAYPDSYENSPPSDAYYPPPPLEDGFSGRGRALSTSGGFNPPAMFPSAPPMTPYPSSYGAKRMRRASSVGPVFGHVGHLSHPYHNPGGVVVRFRASGGHREGISLHEAMHSSVRLSRSVFYSTRDLALDMRGRMILKVRVRFLHYFSIVCASC